MVSKIKKYYNDHQFLRTLVLFTAILIPWIFAVIIIRDVDESSMDYVKKNDTHCKDDPSVYHSKLEELQKPFANAKEVTAACLECHTERHKEILESVHWRWEKEDIKDGNTSVYIGKRSSLNNFCIGVQSNEKTCTRCHIGYGYEDKNFDFTDANAIDCLVCHDNTFTYKKAKGTAGFPATGEMAPDYNEIAQNVCSPKRENCGKCHFWGGGGNNVKHGDLEKALIDCSREVDVHMTTDGADMSCIECHKTENHNITGRNYSNTYSNTNRVRCEQCHQDKPHANHLINDHTVKVSCQTCHIPEYAKENATKMTWDWTTAGRLDENGEPFHEEDAFGNHTYLSIKGDFTWGKNVKPDYIWFNGTADHYTLGDTIESVPVQMNTLNGKYDCANSKIYPMKIFRGKQPYDPINNYLLQINTYGEKKGDSAYWVDFKWEPAIAKGMDYINLPWSGKYDFIETEMYMPINHMVAPAKNTLSCTECHSRDGRLDNLTGFYMPGRDHIAAVDYAGIGLILLSLIAALAHGTIRIITSRKSKA